MQTVTPPLPSNPSRKSPGSPVRLAVIGAGGIAGAHCSAIQSNAATATCVAIAEPDESRRNDRIHVAGGTARGFADWQTMLSELGPEIDGVIICLPHHLHTAAILDACAAGVNILCEKPMCTSLQEAVRIAEAVRTSGVMYMSAHNQLFIPSFRKAVEMVRGGQIGRVLWVRSQDCFVARGWKTKEQGNWRADLKTQGGGELIDTGYHPTYRLLELAGAKPAAVRSTMGRFRLNIDGEDTACVQVRFENGVIGEILTSWAMPNPYGTHQFHVMGEEGQLFGSGNDLYFLPPGCSDPARVAVPADAENTFHSQIAEFARCIRENARPPHGVAEGLAVLEIILGAAENATGWEGK